MTDSKITRGRLDQEEQNATLAMHAILSRMVMFKCTMCGERFPMLHPARLVKPADLDLHVLKCFCRGGVALWDDAPPFEEADEEACVAKTYKGLCLECDLDIKMHQEAGFRMVGREEA